MYAGDSGRRSIDRKIFLLQTVLRGELLLASCSEDAKQSEECREGNQWLDNVIWGRLIELAPLYINKLSQNIHQLGMFCWCWCA